jgi:uncharacterized RDD family membrane protein YckC
MAERLAARGLPGGGREVAGDPAAHYEEGVLGARILAYVIDSVVLMIVSVAFIAAGAAFLFAESDWGRSDTTDAGRWGFVYASLVTVPAWLLINLLLLARRGQSVGQYILGLRVASDDSSDPGPVQLLLYLLALNPLIFHPWLALFWATLAFVTLSITENNILVFGSMAIAILCVAAPLIAFVSAAGGGGRRALHDRIAGTKVVRLE